MDKESKASSASFKLTQASYNYVQNLSKTYVLSLKRDGEILVESYFFFSFPSNGLFYKKKKASCPRKMCNSLERHPKKRSHHRRHS